MIDSLVFDIGNVLVNWNPVPYLTKILGCDETEAVRVNRLVFESKEWKDGDLGINSRADIKRLLTAKHPGDAASISLALSDCDSVLTEFTQSTALLKKLKSRGFKLYYLSNTNPAAYEYMNRNCGFFKIMDGGIASFKEGVLKPSPEIYGLFLTRFEKDGKDCLFIDDMEVNILAAQHSGLNAKRLPSPDALKDVLCGFEEIRKALENE